MNVRAIEIPELIDVDPDDPAFCPRSGGSDVIVRLFSFRIAKYPVTNQEYAVFVRAAEIVPYPRGWDGDAPRSGEENHPVWGVSASDAEAYCRWLSNLTDSTFRLPQEAEWEYAAGGHEQRATEKHHSRQPVARSRGLWAAWLAALHLTQQLRNL